MPSAHKFEDVRFGDRPNRRETQVAIGILFGRSSKQIAADLFLFLATVNVYRLRLFKKFGVHSAEALVRVLMEPPMTTPTIHLLTTNLLDSTAEISINGVRWRYQFLTSAEIDTVKYLFRISGLKAMNYAKRHSESSERIDHASAPTSTSGHPT